MLFRRYSPVPTWIQKEVVTTFENSCVAKQKFYTKSYYREGRKTYNLKFSYTYNLKLRMVQLTLTVGAV